jgi:opacity protein-like surface antigen
MIVGGGTMIRFRSAVFILAAVASLAASTPAAADITAFVGLPGGPSTRMTKGLGLGVGFVIVAFEFEYADTNEDAPSGAPHIQTFMGNVLLQTPVPVAGIQFYGTIGGGGYREDLGTASETNVGMNLGGGVKVKLLGPLRLRADYRVFRLAGSPFGDDVVHRFYVGANLKF